jgi:hypothetical protein
MVGVSVGVSVAVPVMVAVGVSVGVPVMVAVGVSVGVSVGTTQSVPHEPSSTKNPVSSTDEIKSKHSPAGTPSAQLPKMTQQPVVLGKVGVGVAVSVIVPVGVWVGVSVGVGVPWASAGKRPSRRNAADDRNTNERLIEPHSDVGPPPASFRLTPTYQGSASRARGSFLVPVPLLIGLFAIAAARAKRRRSS